MSVVANVAVNLDATGVLQRLKQIQTSAAGAGDAFKSLTGSARSVQSAVEGSQGGFAKASTVIGVFNAKVKNTENAIRAQIAALREVQSSVQLGGALYQKAAGQIKQYEDALRKAEGAADDAGEGIGGLKGRIAAFVGGLALATVAVDTIKKSLSAAFERSQAETRLKALTTAYGETAEATKLAAAASDKFGITQTEATKAIGDVYGRLRPLGFTLKEISGVYDGFNVLSKQAALSSAESASVFTQLSQALGSGTLRGDEFNRMAESMPAILGAVASELKVSQGELRGMAAQGKITADVVVNALQKVGGGAKDLDKFLDPSTKAMNELAKNTEDAQVQLGNLLKPAAIAVLQGLSEALEFTAKNMKAIIQVAVFFGTFAGVIKGIALATQAWAAASKLLAAGQKAAGVAAAFLQGVINPASLATTALALGAATAASYALGKAMDGAATDAKGIDPAAQQAAKATTAAKEEADKLKKAYETAKEEAKELAITMQTQVVAAAKAASEAIETQVKRKGQIGSIVGAQIDGELKLNELYKIGLEKQYEMAKTAGQRRDIAIAIANNEIKAAQLVYQQALANVQIENEKLKLQQQAAVLKGYEILAEGKLQILKAKSPEEARQKVAQLNDALAAQNEVIKATATEVAAQKIVNGYIAKAAETQYKVAVATATSGLEQRLLGDDIGMSAKQASGLANSIYDGATNTKTMNSLSQELSTRMDQAGKALDAGTQAAVGNAEQFSVVAQSGIETTDQWRERVLAGVGAQQQVATAVQQTTETVVAANNIRALSSTQTDAQIVASSNATKTAVVQSNTDAFAGIQQVWNQIATWFDVNVSQKISSAWKFAMESLRGPASMFWGWIPGVVQWGLQTIDAILYNTLILPWKLLWEYVLREPVTKMLQWFQDSWSKLTNFISSNVVAPIQARWNALMQGLVEKATGIRTQINAVWTSIVNFFNNNVIKPIQSAWKTLMEALPNAMKNLGAFVKKIFTDIVNTVKNAIRSVLQFLANSINSISSQVNKLIRAINKLPGAKKIPEIGMLKVPAFAEGGVVNKPTLAMVGEGGESEYIIPESKMAATAANYLNGTRGDSAITKTEGSEGGTINPVINISTGPVLEFNGQQYVTMQDFNTGLQQVADSVYRGLRKSSVRTALRIG